MDMIDADSLKRLLRDKRGTSAIEYALICGLIVLVMVIGFSGFSTATKNTWTTVSTQMSSAANQAAA